MLNNLPILSFLTFLPLFGAFVILLTCSDDDQGSKNSKMVALWTSLITFILSLIVLFNFDNNSFAIKTIPSLSLFLMFKSWYSLFGFLLWIKANKISVDEIKLALERDNFMTADIAKSFGLIDQVVEKRS